MDVVSAEAQKKHSKRVARLDITIGELMMLDRRAFGESLRLLRSGSMYAGTRVQVKVEKAHFSCRRCSTEWEMGEAMRQLGKVDDRAKIREPDSVELPLHFLPELFPSFIECPKCGSSDSFLKGGDEIKITKLLLE